MPGRELNVDSKPPPIAIALTNFAFQSVSYSGEKIAFLTQHGKERIVAPLLDTALECHVEHVTGFDTDLLGTFTREIPRAGTQLEAARKKARKGMEISGLPIGIASEGAFGPDPVMGMLSWNVEFMVFIDDRYELEILGTAQGAANFKSQTVTCWEDMVVFAQQADFPEHYLVARPENAEDPRIRKGIHSWSELKLAYSWARAQSATGGIFLESDTRAHANPTRMEVIRRATQDLTDKVKATCPACNMPGFGPADRIAGLPCRNCGAPTNLTQGVLLACAKCDHHVTRIKADPPYADPANCEYCNP